MRRDFTINALFLDPVNGEIRDYVDGYEDLQARRLRLIGEPELRYREDPVRMLRAVRFATKLGFDGYAVGGLSVGEPPADRWRILDFLADRLPADHPPRPRPSDRAT